MIDYAALKSEVTTDPAGIGYAAWLPHAPGMVVQLLNAQSTSMVKSRMVTARAVMAECPQGADILSKLESASSSSSALRWAIKFLGQDAGLDVGDAFTQGMLDQLSGTVLTAGEATALKNMALQPASRAEVLGFERVTEADLRIALETA